MYLFDSVSLGHVTWSTSCLSLSTRGQRAAASGSTAHTLTHGCRRRTLSGCHSLLARPTTPTRTPPTSGWPRPPWQMLLHCPPGRCPAPPRRSRRRTFCLWCCRWQSVRRSSPHTRPETPRAALQTAGGQRSAQGQKSEKEGHLTMRRARKRKWKRKWKRKRCSGWRFPNQQLHPVS